MNDEALARERTLSWVRDNARWLHADELDRAQREAWKRGRQVFSVVHEDVELFPAYQFVRVEGHWQPRPSIRSILAALGHGDRPWFLAVWLLSANAWLVQREGDDARNLSPAEALERGLDDEVAHAAQRHGDSYVA